MTLSQLLRIRWAVRATLLLGVAASVVANVLHAVDNPISQVIAAWPPFALLLTVELISRVPVHRKSLAFIRMLSTAAIAGIAAWISYWHMAGVAAKYGETGASAYLLPISVDGLILVASICLIELGGRISEEQSAKRAAATAAQAPAPAPAPAPVPAATPARPARPRMDDELFDDDVPGVADLVPRPLAAEAYPQVATIDEVGYPEEYEYEDRRPVADRTLADRTAAAGAMAVAAAERRDRDPLMTSTGSFPVITSDVAAEIEAALSGSQVARGVRGGAGPRNRGGISAASGSLAGRPAGPGDPDPAEARNTTPAAAPQPVPTQRTGAGTPRQTARTSAATSTARRTTTGRVTATPGTPTAVPAEPAPAGAGKGENTQDGAARPRRSAAETAALAAEIEARTPGISESDVADALGITTRRLRDIRRATDTLPA